MEVLRLWQSQQWSLNYSGEVNKPIMNVELMMATDQVLPPSGLYEIQIYLIQQQQQSFYPTRWSRLYGSHDAIVLC